MKNYYVYILTNQRNGTLYIGVTSDLIKHVWQHKNKLADGFTSKYDLNKLVYFELHEDVKFAIAKEKKLKRWKPAWKVVLIEKQNPYWHDLYEKIIG